MSTRRRSAAAAALAAALACGLGCRAEEPAARGSDPALDLRIEFRALWWSPEQLEDLDPNDPPPKQTEVVLERWEYTDPVAVAHPDAVAVVAILGNTGSGALEALELRAASRWKVGPLADEAAAEWGEREPLAPRPSVSLAPGERQEIRLASAATRELQDALAERERWPWAYEIEVEVWAAGGPRPLSAATAVLPILAGD